MQSVLEEFAYGNISPEPRFYKPGSRYGQALEVLAGYERELLTVLNGQEKGLFEKFVESQTEVNLITNADKFIYGYRLGVLMTMEVFNGKNDLIAGGNGSVT